LINPVDSLDFDLVLVGGGLANGLIALRLAQLRPELRVALIEAGPALGGNHTWSLFDDDMTPAQRDWTAPLVAHQWDHYAVRFPGRQRVLPMAYRSTTSERLSAAVTAALPAGHIFLSAPAVSVAADRVILADQRQLTARAVIDGRGYHPSPHLALCWQKFVGQELELAAPHGLTGPVIMDATVPQYDGYRFVYVLPLGPRRVLVEDTYFSDGDALSEEAITARIADYAAAQGWTVTQVLREEAGVLPMAIGGDIDRLWDDATPGVGMTGLQAALFQPATGYSFPDAARSADLIAALPVIDSAGVYRALREHSVRNWRATGFYRYLNLLLFKGAKPDERYRVLERFYGMSDGLVRRFYAGQSTMADRARILIGKPPISVRRAVSLTICALAGRNARG
jgi:lycopene beta-cyclase